MNVCREPSGSYLVRLAHDPLSIRHRILQRLFRDRVVVGDQIDRLVLVVVLGHRITSGDDERLDDLLKLTPGRQMERRFAASVAHVDLGAVVQQHLDGFREVILGLHSELIVVLKDNVMDRSVAFRVADVHVRLAELEQGIDGLGVPLRGGHVNRSLVQLVVARHLDVDADLPELAQHSNDAGVALPCSHVNRDRPVLTFFVQISAVPQQQFHQLRVPEYGRDVQRRVAACVRHADLGAFRHEELDHPIVGSPDGVMQWRAALMVLDVDVTVHVQDGIDGGVQAPSDGHQERRLALAGLLEAIFVDVVDVRVVFLNHVFQDGGVVDAGRQK